MKRNKTQWRDGLSLASWQDFERLLARHYREEGYEVEHCGTAEGAGRFDGGVDLVLRRDGETILVQCKHWNAAQVPHNDVHQLLGLVETCQAQRAILVTSGEFTAAAKNAASKSARIELIDGASLRLMIDPRLIPEPRESAATDPFADGSLGDLTFRSRTRSARRRDEVPVAIWLGAAVLLAIALGYPAYSYQVQKRLAQRDVAAAVTAVAGQVDAMSKELQRQTNEASRRSAAQALAQRQSGVVVSGTTIVGGTRVAIVQMGQASLAEAKEPICRQAAARFRQPLAGERLRVQRHRGSQPAVDEGTIVCD